MRVIGVPVDIGTEEEGARMGQWSTLIPLIWWRANGTPVHLMVRCDGFGGLLSSL